MGVLNTQFQSNRRANGVKRKWERIAAEKDAAEAAVVAAAVVVTTTATAADPIEAVNPVVNVDDALAEADEVVETVDLETGEIEEWSMKNRKSELLEAAHNAGIEVEASWTKAAILEALNGG